MPLRRPNTQTRCPEGYLFSSSLQAQTLRRPMNPHRYGGQLPNPKVSECVAGISADCAAICCCPFAPLHLLALLFLKIPAIVRRKMVFNLKKKLLKRKIGVGGEEGGGGTAPWTPSWSYKDRFMGEDMVQSSGDVLDQEFLREYFCCKQLGFGDQELFEHAMESDEIKSGRVYASESFIEERLQLYSL